MNNKTIGIMCLILVTILASGGRVNAADSTYCIDDNTLHIISEPNITVSDTVVEFDAVEINCQYGCTDEAWTNLGNPACKESPIVLYVLTIMIIVVCVYIGIGAIA